jgi:hypothetical protein
MGGPWTGRAGTNPESAGELGLTRRRERGALLMTDSEPRHAVVAADGIRKCIEGVSDDAKNLIYTKFRKGRGQ